VVAVDSILEDALGPDSTQALAQKRDLLERLMARLAHEIRNPLSSLGVHFQLLEEDVSSLAPGAEARLADRFEIIRGELHRLESIVGHFLRLAGPSALEIEELDLLKVAGHVCELLRPEAGSRGITLTLETPAEALPSLHADRVRITQVLVNLVINAMQAVKRDGHVRINLAANDTSMRVQVTDDGPGIPPEKLAAVFDPYYTTKEEGTGLGLWIAQQIVTGHNGSLRAQSGEKGAVFTMVLPLRQPSTTQEGPS